MLKVRVALLGALALLIVSGVAAAPASALGPYWRVDGSRLETKTWQVKLQNKGPIKLRAPMISLELTCQRGVSEGATIEGNNGNQGQDKGRLTFTSCTSNAAGCTVAEPITTNPTKSFLATAATQTKIVDAIEPGIGAIFAVIKLSGANCALAGELGVTGTTAAEIIPAGVEVQEALVVFPNPPLAKITHEGFERLRKLEVIGFPAIFEGVFAMRVDTGDKFGVFET